MMTEEFTAVDAFNMITDKEHLLMTMTIAFQIDLALQGGNSEYDSVLANMRNVSDLMLLTFVVGYETKQMDDGISVWRKALEMYNSSAMTTIPGITEEMIKTKIRRAIGALLV